MPGAIQAMARAAYEVGITSEATELALGEMMEQGKVASEDILPEFGRQMWLAANEGDALQKAINSTSAAYGRLGTNVYMANKTFNEAGLDKGMRRLANSVSEFLLKSEGLIKFFGMLSGEIASRFGVVFEVLETFGYWSTKLGDALEKLEEKGINLDIAFMALSGTLALISKWFRRIFMFVYLLPWALSKTADTLKGNFGDDAVDSISRVVAVLMTVYGTLRLIRGVKTGLGSLFGGGKRGVPPLRPDVAGTAVRAGILTRMGTHLATLAGAVVGGKLGVAVLALLGATSITAAFGALGTLIVDAIRNPLANTGSDFESKYGDLTGDNTFTENIQRMRDDLTGLFTGTQNAMRSLQETSRMAHGRGYRNNQQVVMEPVDFQGAYNQLVTRLYEIPPMSQQEASRQIIQGGITINVDGAGDPQVVSEEVLRTIQNVFRETASLEPETEQ